MNKNTSEVLERFYICTNLPVIALNLEGDVLDSSGYNYKFNSLLEENNIFDESIDKLKNSSNEQTVIISCPNSINFTACTIDSKNLHRGIYILGPHSCKENNSLNVPYKPRCLMGNLVSLIYIIDNDINHGRYFKSTYSYHVKRALDYIQTRYSNDIDLLHVANYLNISKSYLCSLIKKEVRKTFTQFLNEVRIEKSKNLLLEDNSSILDIALAVGFNNQNYYNIMFKKITGKTPLEFRKEGYN